MKIGIDIDDTLTNTKEQQLKYWKHYVNDYPKEGYTEEIPKTINDFGDEYVQEFWDKYRHNLTFECTFKENASNIIHKLLEDGHELQIITARDQNKYPNLKEKIAIWFKENDIPITRINTGIREKAKFARVNSFDMIIDDNVTECIKANQLGVKAILFNQDETYPGFQTTNWQEVYLYIKSTKYQN